VQFFVRRKLIYALAAALGASLPVAVFGQIQSQDSIFWSVEVDEAVVTGETSAVKAENALRVINKLRLDEVRFGSSQTLQDALRLTNGIRMNHDLALGGGLSMNGLGGLNIKIMLDGVPLVGRLGGNIDLGQIRLDLIESIEIVDGPMAVEFGTNSLAGAINLLTKKSKIASPSLTTMLRYESVGDYTQSVNASWSGTNHSTTISCSNHVFDGWSVGDPFFDWIEDFVADSSRVASWNPKQQRQFNFKSTLTVGNWTLSPTLFFLDEKIINRGLPRGPYGLSAFDDEYQTRRFLPSLQVKSFDENGVGWNIIASVQSFSRRKNGLITDLTTLTSELQSAQQQDTTGVTSIMSRGTRNVNLNSNWSIRFGWDINHENYKSERIENGLQAMTDAAAFALTTFESTSFKGQFGIRQAWNSSFQNPLLPSVNTLIKSGLNRFRFSYASGYRAPTLKELYFRFVDINHQLFGNPNLKAESSNYSEMSWSRAQKNFQIRSKIFVNDVVDRISLVDQLDGTYRYENISRFNARGISVSADSKWGRVQLSGGFQYTGREQTLTASDNSSDVLWTPEFTGSVQFEIVEPLSFNLNAKHNGSQPRNVIDDQDQIVIQKSEPYSMLDAQLRWQQASWTLQFGVNNIFDVTTAQALENGGAHSSGTTWLAWGRSMSFTLTHKLRAKGS